MSKNCFLFIGLILLLLSACRSTDISKLNKARINDNDLSFLAWNEDTSHSYQFAVSKKKTFFYTIIKKDSIVTKEYYYGKISRHSSGDIIFLDYYKDQKPKGLNDYLQKEISGIYLIQSFEDSSKRIFLRRQKLGHWR